VLGTMPEVRIMIPPKGMVQLWAWIQCTDDRTWWACVGWTTPHDDSLVLCTGYGSPDNMRKRHDVDYTGVPRLSQSKEPSAWPPPAPLVGDYRWPGPHHHYGQLDGRKLEPPTPTARWLWLTR
jgi:hypothetical protein